LKPRKIGLSHDAPFATLIQTTQGSFFLECSAIEASAQNHCKTSWMGTRQVSWSMAVRLLFIMMQFDVGIPIQRMAGAERAVAAKPKGEKRDALIQSFDRSSPKVALLGRDGCRLVTSGATLGFPPSLFLI
jgi:hypothetical protein